MGRKKRTIVALKPFCYYCDKEFNNEIILHQHQKARHFNCTKCRKRFSTAPALDTHALQVHKSKLNEVPNAIAGRNMYDISIYGMDGVPIELINYKLAEKVAMKRRRLIRQQKLEAEGGEEELLKEKESSLVTNKKGQKEKSRNGNNKKKGKEIIDVKALIAQGTGGFYHNPDSINLTLNKNQMNSMFNYGPNQQQQTQ